MPCVWQFRGQPPLDLLAVRVCGRHSLLGFWQTHALGQPLQAYVQAGALTADLLVLAVNDFCQTLDGPTVLVLAYASIHTDRLVRACHAKWAAQVLTLLFLPPYSHEINHIELPWHRCKDYWIRPEDDQFDRTLLQRIKYVLKRIGKYFTINFA